MASVDANADLCNLPAAVSPTGVYNFTDPESMKTTVFSVSIVLTVIASLLTAGRVWVNRRKLSLADYTIVASMLLGIGFLVVVLLQGRYFRHQWDVPACWMTGDYMKLVFMNTLFFGLCLGLGKVSILLLYLQIFAVQRPVRRAIYLALFFTIGLYITFIPCDALFEAPRIGESWDDLIINGRPNKAVPWSLAIGAGSVLIDLYIFILPIPILIKLHTSTSKRVQIVLLFGTALFGVAASIIAVVYRVPLLAPTNLLTPNIDNTWHVAQIYIANFTECMVAISVACLPACVNLFRQSTGDTNAWRSLKSAFTKRSIKYRSDGKGSDIAEKPFARQGGAAWGPKQAQIQADSFEMTGPDGTSSQTDMYVPPESYAGVAVNADQGNDASGYQDRVWVTRTVDVHQQPQPQQQQQQNYGRWSDSIV